MLHSAFQFYSFSHCTVHFPPLPPPLILSSPFSSEQGINSIEGGGGRAKGVQSWNFKQARWTERKMKGMGGTKADSNIHNNQTPIPDWLTIQ